MKINKRKLLFAITGLIIAGILIFNIPGIYDFFMYSDHEEVQTLIGGDYHLERYEDGMLAYNNNEISFVSDKGEVKWNVAVKSATPKVYVEDKFILLADLSGTNAYLYEGKNLRTTIKAKEEIFAAALDPNGKVALATKAKGYKGGVTVYNKNGESEYVFGSGNGYISALDIRKDKFVISQISAKDDAIYSTVALVDWTDNEEKICETKTGEMVFDIKFLSNGDFVAVSDKSLSGYGRRGEIDYTVSYNGRELKNYNIESDDNMVFCFSGDRNDSVIESYSRRGKLRGTRSESETVSNVDACGEAILISSMRNIKRVYPDGDADDAVTSLHDVRRIKLFKNRRYAFVTGNSSATVVKVKN